MIILSVLMIIWCVFNAYLILIWCLFDNYLTIIWCLFDAYLIIICCLFATNNDQISINIGSNHKIRIKLSSNNHQIIFNSSMLLTMQRRSDDMRRPRWRCWWRLAETTPLSRIGRPRRRWRGGRGLGQHLTVVGKLRGPEACAARISGWIPRGPSSQKRISQRYDRENLQTALAIHWQNRRKWKHLGPLAPSTTS